MRLRKAWLLGGGGASVLLIVAALVLAQFVRSPAQQVADTAPPPRTVLTAMVEQRVLEDTVVVRGQVGADTTVEVAPAPVGVERAVVTGVRVAPGDEFEPGEVLMEVSGRPVFALTGEVPAFRDLRPGMTGRDVVQLQDALAEVGHSTGDADGEFGVRTKTALASFYRKLGYEPPTTGDTEALLAADASVRQAERALTVAEETLDQVRGSATPTPGSGGADPVAEAERQVEFAQEDVEAARAARAEIERSTGAMLPLSEVVFLPELPARVEQVAADVGLELAGLEAIGPPLVVSSGDLVVRAQVSPVQRDLLTEGMPVEILSELEETNVAGEITSIGELTEDPATGTRGHPVTVTPTDGPLNGKLAGADVRLTIVAGSTEEEVLVVPLSAVYATADGTTAVLRVTPAGEQERVEVTPGASGDGYVAVASPDGDLAAGDEVVVGSGGDVP